MGKRWMAALAASAVLLTFGACGGDDDDDDAVGTDDTEESSDETEDDGGDTQAALCAELDIDTGDEATIEEIEEIIGVMESAAADAPSEVAEALGVIGGIYQEAIDGDDGDGVVTDEEGGALLEANPEATEAFNVVFDYCQDTGGAGETGDDGAAEQAEADEAKATFCAELNETSDEVEPVEEVQQSLDTAVAAQTVAETQEQFDALQLVVDFTQYVIDNDDGDGMISSEELSAAAPEFPTVEDAFLELDAWCNA